LNCGTLGDSRRSALPNKGPNDGFITSGARLAYSPDGTIVGATSTRDGLIFLFDAASGRELGRLDWPPNRCNPNTMPGPGGTARDPLIVYYDAQANN
jgi:hypothetical protein